MKKGLLLAALLSLALSCTDNKAVISPEDVKETTQALLSAFPSADTLLVGKGVSQTAALWRESDGTPRDFKEFVLSHYEGTPEGRKALFDKMSYALETINGAYNLLSIDLQKPTVLAGDEPQEIDYVFSAFNPYAHLSDDLFENKAAFTTVLNFPRLTHAEKESRCPGWSRLDWAYARMGDVFTDRIPSDVQVRSSEALSAADNYISSYNIMMGHLLDTAGRRLFPEDMVLLSHWNLRDEIKSNYAGVPFAAEKQEMIYRVMERIVSQEIPECVINDPSYDWNPYTNEVFRDGAKVDAPSEGERRYQMIVDQFKTYLETDSYCGGNSTAVTRFFDEGLEFSVQELTNLFTTLLSSEEVGKVAGVIKERLGRELRPYDIWYDGFKSRSAYPEDFLSAKTRALYPTAEAFHEDTPRLLKNMGFSAEDAKYISDRVVVEPSRGSGHAWQCESRTQPARLRTRVGAAGMDYKGYNIAVHEFGHNVEQVLSLYDIDYYTLRGIPDNGFTEAMAFLFQMRDLQLLGLGEQNMDADAVMDKFWGMCEIMGVSLVEMRSWQWLYTHKDATAAQYKEMVLGNAADVWNEFFAKWLGTPGSTILAVYSHMIDYPMYLPSYCIGDIVHFQLEQHLAGCSDQEQFASELKRIYTLGHLTPNAWMKEAVGSEVSIEPVLEAVRDILN